MTAKHAVYKLISQAAVIRAVASVIVARRIVLLYSVSIAPSNAGRRMRSGRRLILRIEVAKASEPERGGHALFKGCETAIRAAADRSTAVNGAPWIVLGLG